MKKIFTLTSVLAVMIFGFQNCGDLSSTQLGSKSGLASVAPTNFKAGDDFDLEKRPFKVSDSLLSKRLLNYEKRSSPKAIAFSMSGKGIVNGTSNAKNQADINRATLESCELISGGEPCAIMVEGMKFKYDFNDFESHIIKSIKNTSVFDAMKIPGLIEKWRTEQNQTYPLREETYKALAIGLNVTAHVGWSEVSQQDANRRAVEFCESFKTTPRCFLYAVDEDVVFNSNDFDWPPGQTLFFAPSLLSVNSVPFVESTTRNDKIQPKFNDFIQNNKHLVISLSKYGHYGISIAEQMSEALVDSAVSKCNAQIPSGKTGLECFVYSIDSDVLMQEDDLTNN